MSVDELRSKIKILEGIIKLLRRPVTGPISVLSYAALAWSLIALIGETIHQQKQQTYDSDLNAFNNKVNQAKAKYDIATKLSTEQYQNQTRNITETCSATDEKYTTEHVAKLFNITRRYNVTTATYTNTYNNEFRSLDEKEVVLNNRLANVTQFLRTNLTASIHWSVTTFDPEWMFLWMSILPQIPRELFRKLSSMASSSETVACKDLISSTPGEGCSETPLEKLANYKESYSFCRDYLPLEMAFCNGYPCDKEIQRYIASNTHYCLTLDQQLPSFITVDNDPCNAPITKLCSPITAEFQANKAKIQQLKAVYDKNMTAEADWYDKAKKNETTEYKNKTTNLIKQCNKDQKNANETYTNDINSMTNALKREEAKRPLPPANRLFNLVGHYPEFAGIVSAFGVVTPAFLLAMARYTHIFDRRVLNTPFAPSCSRIFGGLNKDECKLVTDIAGDYGISVNNKTHFELIEDFIKERTLLEGRLKKRLEREPSSSGSWWQWRPSFWGASGHQTTTNPPSTIEILLAPPAASAPLLEGP